MNEIERLLRVVSGARQRAEQVAKELAKNSAEEHLVAAVERAERELGAVSDHLLKGTYFAVPKEQLTIS